MSVRSATWIAHGVVVGALLVLAGVWAAALAASDSGAMLRIGHALATLVLGVAAVYALLSTALVAALARRARDVLAVHAITLGVVVAVTFAFLTSP